MIHWPSSAQIDIFVDLKGNQQLKVIEGSVSYEVITAAVTTE